MCVCYHRDLIQIKRLNQESILPQQATNQVLVSGYDITSSTMMTILASTNVTVPLGFTMSYLDHLQCSIYPRSSISLKGIDVALGTIDTDYRGEDKVIIAKNTSSDPFNITIGQCVGQLIFPPIVHTTFKKVNSLQRTLRGTQKFGSTGNNNTLSNSMFTTITNEHSQQVNSNKFCADNIHTQKSDINQTSTKKIDKIFNSPILKLT